MNKMNSVSVKQGKEMRQKILQAIISYIEQHGYPPTYREIGDMVGIKSTSMVSNQIERMVELGMIKVGKSCSPRAIKVVGYKFVKESEIK